MQNLCASNDASMAVLLYLDRAMQSQGQCNSRSNVIPGAMLSQVLCYPKVNTVPNSYAFFNALLFLKKFGAELTCALEGDAVLPFLD